jgi:UDP-N-acetylmuramoyl-L-alanyl-D-glutamate--2,6-diaminopimelate ligase
MCRCCGSMDLRDQVGEIAARFYDRPTESMRVVGITGTNGKTSCVQLLAQALTFLGHRAATIGTLGAGLHGSCSKASAPRQTRSACSSCWPIFAMPAPAMWRWKCPRTRWNRGRVSAVDFEVAAFTNLTRDHLDYHGSMEAYGAAKAKLFAWLGLQVAVINIDDAFGADLLATLSAGVQALRVSSTGVGDADIIASAIVTSPKVCCSSCVHRGVRAW